MNGIIRKMNVFLIFLIVFLPSTLFAEVVIDQDTTWDAANSPYIFNEDVTIKDGISLTISPGTVVKFADGTGLYVQGNLDVNGTKDSEVVFGAINKQWKGIVIGDDPYCGWGSCTNNLRSTYQGLIYGWLPSVNIKYLDISGAETALNIHSSKVSVEFSWIYANNTAINITGVSDVSVISSVIAKNGNGILWVDGPLFLFVETGDYHAFHWDYNSLYDRMCSGGGIVVENSFIVNNGGNGIDLEFVSDCLKREIKNNTIVGNAKTGVLISYTDYTYPYDCYYFDYDQCQYCVWGDSSDEYYNYECYYYQGYDSYQCDDLEERCSQLPFNVTLVKDNIVSNNFSNLDIRTDYDTYTKFISISNNCENVQLRDPANMDFAPVSDSSCGAEALIEPNEALNIPSTPVGTLYEDEFFQGDVELIGSIFVPNDINLKIKRGINVLLGKEAGLFIKGDLTFIDNEQDDNLTNSLVAFKPMTDDERWDGIYFYNKEDLSIKSLNIIKAENGLSLEDSYGEIELSKFDSCKNAIKVSTGTSSVDENVHIHSCAFKNNSSYDIYFLDQSSSKITTLKITNNLFLNGHEGVYVYAPYDNEVTLNLYNNIFNLYSYAAIRFWNYKITAHLYNNIFIDNKIALYFVWSTANLDTFDISYNDFYDNENDITRYRYVIPLPDNNYQVDPLFISSDRNTPADFQLSQDSPCIDAGKPDMLDRDGTRSDLGIWGGNSDFIGNQPPHQPAAISPADGEVLQISNQICLQASEFQDDDQGDSHIASRWQLFLKNQDGNESLINDQVVNSHLQSFCLIDMPSEILNNLQLDAVYCWKVSYQDDFFNWSPFSEEACFNLEKETSPPDIQINWNYDTYLFDSTDYVYINWTATDNVPFGLKNYYQLDDHDWQGPVTRNTFSFRPHEGTNTFNVKAVDLSGNENTASISFVVDTLPPSITDINVNELDHDSAVVCVNADEDVIAQISYGPDSEYIFSTDFPNVYQEQNCITLSGLEGDAIYHYQVAVKDRVGHLVHSEDRTFTTPASPNPEDDNPKIQGLFLASRKLLPQDLVLDEGALTLKASDPSGINRAEFYVDGNLLFVDDDPGDGLDWNVDPSLIDNSEHLLEIKVYDVFGKVSSISYQLYAGIPDINISLVPISGSFYLGDTLNVFWTVTNNGDSDLPQSVKNCIYLSEDDAFGDDLELACTPSPVLLPPERSYQRATTVTLPKVDDGDYHILVATVVDEDLIAYSSTGPFSISHRPLPDLSASNLEIGTDSVRAGEVLSLGWQATNHGEIVTSSTWVDGVWLCPDGKIDEWWASDDKHVGQFENPVSLDVGQTYTQSVQVTIPSDISGDYYVVIRLNEKGLAEASRQDNILVSLDPIHVERVVAPTVVVEGLKITPKQPWPGQEVTVSWRLKNIGDIATGPVTIRHTVYLSKDDRIDWGDRVINSNLGEFTGNIAPGEVSDTISFTFSSPWDIWGEYLLLIDPMVPNGISKVPGKEIIVLDPGMPSDLTLQEIDCPPEIQTGNYWHFSWTVINEANEPTHVANWVDELIFSRDNSLETSDDNIKVAEIPHHGTLDYEESYTVEKDVFIPQDFVTGSYHVFVKVDARNQVYEGTFENNNINSDNITTQVVFLAPDLQVESAFINNQESITTSPGQTVLFNWTVRNSGLGNAPGGWMDAVYLSSGGNLEGSAFLLGWWRYESLPEGGQYSSSRGYTIPSNIASGDYTVFFCTDTSQSVIEGNEANNCISRSITVSPAPPDLTIDNLALRPVDLTQGLFDISWHVRNLGGAVAASSWTDKIFLSQDTRYDEDDLYLGEFTHQGTLGEYGDYSSSLTDISIPVEQLGSSHVLVLTDFDQVVPEGNEQNNLAYRPTPVPVVNQVSCEEADLTVLSLSMPDKAYAGQFLSISWEIGNNGIGAASNWYDAVYLSLDPYLDRGQDVYLGSKLIRGPVQAGDKLSINDFPVSLPRNLVGPYYIIIATDTSDRICETDETNNWFVSPDTIEISTAPPSDLNVVQVSFPASAYSGEQMPITWVVQNSGGFPAVGNWKDALYLSTDETLDSSDIKIGEVAHQGEVAPGQSYQAELNAAVTGVLPGNYYVIVRTDNKNEVNEGAGGEQNNIKASGQTVFIDNRPLTLGQSISKEITNGQVHYYKIEDVPVGETLKIEASCPTQDTVIQLFVAHGYVPDEGHYDYIYDKPFWHEQRIIIPEAESGTYYVMIKAQNRTHTSCNYTILAKTVGFEVYDVTPDHGGNTGYVTVTIKGSKLDTVTSIGLKLDDDIVMDDIATIKSASSSELEAVLDLRFIDEGNYSLQITADNQDVLMPFTIVNGGDPHFEAYVSGVDYMRVDNFYTYTVNIKNTGLVDAAFSEVVISVPSSFESHIDLDSAYREDDGNTTFYVVGLNEIPVNKLIEIPVEVKGFGAHQKGEIKVWCYELHFKDETVTITTNDVRHKVTTLNPDEVTNIKNETESTLDELSKPSLDRSYFVQAYLITGESPEEYLNHYVFVLTDNKGNTNIITVTDRKPLHVSSSYQEGAPYSAIFQLVYQNFSSINDVINYFKNKGYNNVKAYGARKYIWVDENTFKAIKDYVKNGIYVTIDDTWDKVDYDYIFKQYTPSPDLERKLMDMGYGNCQVAMGLLLSKSFEKSGDDFLKHAAIFFHAFGFDTASRLQLMVALGLDDYIALNHSISSVILSPHPLYTNTLHLSHYMFSRPIESVTSNDPNEKSTVMGYGDSHFISKDKAVPYTIYFENKSDAAAPAQKVTIVDKLDPNLDWRTLQLETINFGNVNINVPGHRAFYSGTVELDNGLVARMEVKLDIFTGTVKWVLEAIDPETGEAPEDPMLGLLPPNDPNTHVGEGYVTFSIKPKKDIETSAKIVNQATIVFDNNEPMDTNAVFNTIDAGAPESSIAGGSQVTTDPMIHLSWAGRDDENGSGIRIYEIYVSVDDNPYFMWKAVNGTSADYEASPGHTYKFFSVGVDQVGNREAQPDSPDLTVDVVIQAPHSPEPETGAEDIDPAQLQLSWQPAYQAESYDLYIWKDGENRPETPTASGLTATSFDASNILDFSTIYRWQVLAHTPDGDFESEVWMLTTAANPDADGDGMPDEWEIQYFGTTERDGTGDFDGDGLTDLEEYQSGSDPTASNAPTIPQILAPTDKGEVGELSPLFTVTNSTDPDGDEIIYDYEIYQDEGLSQLVLSDTQDMASGNETTSWTASQELTENTWYYWRVRATDGHGYSQWAYGSFFVNVSNDAPEGCRIDYPEDGSFIDTARPTLRVINAIDPDGDDMRVSFDLFSDSSFENQVASSGWIMPGEDGNTTWQVDQDLMEDHEYQLFVTFIDENGANGTCGPVAFTVNTSNQAPPRPEIVEPITGAEIGSDSIDLVVANTIDPDGDLISFLFQIDTSEDFDSSAIMESGDISQADGQNTSWHIDGFLENTWYYWRVRASDGISQSPWSYGSFFVNAENEPPATPNVVNPGNGAEVSDITPVLEVTPVTDPDSDSVTYRFMLYSDSEGTQLVVQEETTDTRWQVPLELSNRTTYYWTCQAVDEHGLAGEAMPLSEFVINTGEMIPDHLGLIPETSEVEVGQAFRLTVRVLDSDGQLVEGFNGSVSLDVDQGTINPSTLTGFVNGVWDGQVIIDGIYDVDVTITAQADSGITGEVGPITVTCVVPLPPERVYPEDNATINNGDITFSWNVREGAQSYEIQVASDNETKDVIYEASDITTAFIQVPSSELGDLLQPGETYYWRMRSAGECGSGNWTEPWSFTIPFVEPELTLSYPVGGESVAAGSTVTIEWSYQGDVGDTIKIRYNTGGRRWNTIVTGVDVTSGSYNWTLPSGLTGRCRIKIESEENRTIYSTGGYFNIE